jgi:hypothetical protein
VSDGYVFHFAYDEPQAPWTGPYTSQASAVLAAQRDGYGTGARDGGQPRLVFIKSAQQVGPNAFLDTGYIEKIEPEHDR